MATHAIPDIWDVHRRKDELLELCRTERYTFWLDGLIDECAVLLTGEDTGETADGKQNARLLVLEAEQLAWAHLLSGDPRYAEAAKERLGAVERVTAGWERNYHTAMYPKDRADLHVSETIKSGATALSILDPVLTDEERDRLALSCCINPGRIIYEDAISGCWWADALNSNWTAVLNSALGFAAIVHTRDDEGEARLWLEFARSRMIEMLDLAGEEAGGVEGPSYWVYCFGSIQDFAIAERSIGGGSMLEHRFWNQAPRYLPYFVRPDFSGWINYGDTPYDSMSGSHLFHGIARYATEGKARVLAQGFAERMLDHHSDPTWKNLLHFDPAVEAGYFEDEPRSRCFKSVHLASFRSGWKDDDTLLFVRGGSNAWSHMHLDLASFVIHAAGERLAVDPGPVPYSVHYWHSIVDEVSTRWHNCLVVDGANQRMGPQFAMTNSVEDAGDCYAKMGAYVHGETIDLLEVDASEAYGDTLDRAVRWFAFLAPGVIVVFDDCQTKPLRVQRNFEWLLHSECPLVDDDNRIVARGKRADLAIHTLFPPDREYKFMEGKVLPKSDGRPLHGVSIRPAWHHKWNVNPERSPYPHWHPQGDREPLYGSTYRFLNVLEVVRHEDETRYEVATVGGDANGFYGAVMTKPGERSLVLFNPDGKQISVADAETDARVITVRDFGNRIEWAAAEATCLTYRGDTLFSGQARSFTADSR